MHGLEYWINPKHLLPESIERLAEAYTSDHLKTIWLDDFLLPEHVAGLKRLFTGEGEFKQVYRFYGDTRKSRTRTVDSEAWQKAEPGERFHHELKFTGPKPEHRMSTGMVTLVRYQMFLESAAYQGFLHRLTGIAPNLVPSSLLRITRHGHCLNSHSDFIDGRKLCGILYFSDGWDPLFGGRLRQYKGNEMVRALDPLSNRLVLFSPIRKELHDVEPLSDHAMHWERQAMTTWYSPPGTAQTEQADAIFAP